MRVITYDTQSGQITILAGQITKQIPNQHVQPISSEQDLIRFLTFRIGLDQKKDQVLINGHLN